MKILLLVPKYLDLYKPIIEELKNQGHQTKVIFDKNLFSDPYGRFQKTSKLKQIIKKIIFVNIVKLYWIKRIREDKELNLSYDILFCINGCSFDNYLLKHLKIINPSIRSIIYLWDTSKYYDYIHNIKYFDKVLSFDIDDCKKYSMIFLPFYWKPSTCMKSKIVYTMSIVGSNHDGRLEIIEKIAKQLNDSNLNYYFKLYMPLVELKRDEKKLFKKAIKNKDLPTIRYYKLLTGKTNSEYIVHSIISVDDVQRIMSQSEIILDTDRETQTGTTPRLIWALAMGKKIVTTNENIKIMPFYNPTYISIIDRDNPILDKNFILDNNSQTDQVSSLFNYRIDNWIKFILSNKNSL